MELKNLLDQYVNTYNVPGFITNDPISIPHRYSRKEDIEITAFWTSMLAWGQRVTIINKATELFSMMGDSPYDFIVNHNEEDRKPFLDFKHRTFQPTDTLYFLEFFQQFYRQNESLEFGFSQFIQSDSPDISPALSGFHELFFNLPDSPQRTRKHVATPVRKSTCKRLNMFLRWMVRQDKMGVDFGIWKNIKPAQLMIPLDVHVERIARKFGLIKRKQRDWKTVVELTAQLRKFDANDPAKYDFALFGYGVEEKSRKQI